MIYFRDPATRGHEMIKYLNDSSPDRQDRQLTGPEVVALVADAEPLAPSVVERRAGPSTRWTASSNMLCL